MSVRAARKRDSNHPRSAQVAQVVPRPGSPVGKDTASFSHFEIS